MNINISMAASAFLLAVFCILKNSAAKQRMSGSIILGSWLLPNGFTGARRDIADTVSRQGV